MENRIIFEAVDGDSSLDVRTDEEGVYKVAIEGWNGEDQWDVFMVKMSREQIRDLYRALAKELHVSNRKLSPATDVDFAGPTGASIERRREMFISGGMISGEKLAGLDKGETVINLNMEISDADALRIDEIIKEYNKKNARKGF